MPIITVDPKNGDLVVQEPADAKGEGGSRRTVQAWQVAAHRRDPAFEALLPSDIKAALVDAAE